MANRAACERNNAYTCCIVKCNSLSPTCVKHCTVPEYCDPVEPWSLDYDINRIVDAHTNSTTTSTCKHCNPCRWIVRWVRSERGDQRGLDRCVHCESNRNTWGLTHRSSDRTSIYTRNTLTLYYRYYALSSLLTWCLLENLDTPVGAVHANASTVGSESAHKTVTVSPRTSSTPNVLLKPWNIANV